MKYFLITASLLLLLEIGACKKESSTATPKKFLISKISDSVGYISFKYYYGADNELLNLDLGTSVLNFTYNSQHQVVVRRQLTGAAVTNVDSFFYDGYGNIVNMRFYDNTLTKLGEASFSYDGSFRVNSIIRKMVASSDSRLDEFEYANGSLSSATQYEFDGTFFKRKSVTEFFAYDSVPNPFRAVVNKQLPDVSGGTYYFMVSDPNNAKSIRQTRYDISSGAISSVDATTLKYQYNSDNLVTSFSSGPFSYDKFNVEYVQVQ